jgi:glycerol-3-phosphate dehydrogenase
MAEDVVNTAIQKNNLEQKKCITTDLKIHAAQDEMDFNRPLYYYGTDEKKIKLLVKNNPELGELIHPDLPYIKAEIVWAVQEEMCMTVEDALTRRTRGLLLHAQAAIEASPVVAKLMAKEMNKDQQWQDEQLSDFRLLAKNYLSAEYS